MAPKIARADQVDRAALHEFLATRHHGVLLTTRTDGGPQLSPVTCGLDTEGRVVISTYPERAKVANIRRTGRAAVCVLSDEWNDSWVQVEGPAEVLDLPEALDGLVEYFRCISGEHPDWDEYRQAMVRQGKCLVRVSIERWSPVATGGFPAARVTSPPS
jgi:PPOX class probable F420-dependent enzyme